MLVTTCVGTPGNRARLRRLMGPAFAPVVLGNPTGLYELDMSVKMDREAMLKVRDGWSP
jgi:hypothetical protein